MFHGLAGITYYGTAGGEPTDVLDNVRDVTYSIEVGTAEVSHRSNNGWKEKSVTVLDASCEFGLVWDGTLAGQVAIRAAIDGGTKIALGFRDVDNGYGFYGDFVVEKFSHEQPLEDGQTVSVSCKGAGALAALVPTP